MSTKVTATLYSDASWCPQNKVGGWGIYCRSDKGKFEDHGQIPDYCQDNNVAELAAIFAGFYRISKVWPDTTMIYVRSDCKGALGLADIMQANHERDDIRRLQENIVKLKIESNISLQLGWVKGHQNTHNNIKGWVNDRVDGLAYSEMLKARNRVK